MVYGAGRAIAGRKRQKVYWPGVCSHEKHVCAEKHSSKSYKAKLLEIELHEIIDFNISSK